MPDIKEPIYEPRKFYEERLKQQYHDEATRFFDEPFLVKNNAASFSRKAG